MKVIIFNAAPNSGKDEACETITIHHKEAVHLSFKESLVFLTQELFFVRPIEWMRWYSTREGKEMKRKELGGMSCREALIFVSENVIKPAFGKDYFGRAMVEHIKNYEKWGTIDGVQHIVISDGGFNEEVVPIINYVGEENVYIVRIEREGCSWKGDSRGWIDLEIIPDENYITLHNDGTKEEFQQNVLDTYEYIKSRM